MSAPRTRERRAAEPPRTTEAAVRTERDPLQPEREPGVSTISRAKPSGLPDPPSKAITTVNIPLPIRLHQPPRHPPAPPGSPEQNPCPPPGHHDRRPRHLQFQGNQHAEQGARLGALVRLLGLGSPAAGGQLPWEVDGESPRTG